MNRKKMFEIVTRAKEIYSKNNTDLKSCIYTASIEILSVDEIANIGVIFDATLEDLVDAIYNRFEELYEEALDFEASIDIDRRDKSQEKSDTKN